MELNANLELEPEDGTQRASLWNVYKMAQTNGTPVAVTHIVTPRGSNITKVFFFSGRSITLFGLSLEEEDRLLGLLFIIQMIFMLPIFMEQNISDLNEIIQEAKKQNKNAVFNFFAPEEKVPDLVKNSNGFLAFKTSDEFMQEDQINLITNIPIQESENES
jgi:hypothetical protein